MNYKYNCLNPIAEVGLGNLDDKYTRTENFAEADAVFVRSAKMDDLAVSENLLAVARAGAGVNNIPHAEYAKKGIVVFNTPGANANGVKELVIAGMLLASRDIVGGIEWVKENVNDPTINKTAEKAKKAFAGTEILGKRLGVIGLGAIGQKVANAAVELGMEVYGYDPYLSIDAAWNLDHAVKHCKNVEAIYRACDFITIHVPALDSTKGMINAESIAMMKTGVIINIGSLSRLKKCAKNYPGSRICLRFNPDVCDGDNKMTMTGGDLTKFGILLDAVEEVKTIVKSGNLHVVGLHEHTGSGLQHVESVLQSMRNLMAIATKENFPELEFMDFGGGFKVPYRPDEAKIDYVAMGAQIDALFDEFCNIYLFKCKHRENKT